MATHKVPQDVEAEDKLIGFLSLKQFLFAIAFAICCYLAYAILTTFNPFLAILMLPLILLFGVLAFWQRREQPIETYLSAMFRFYTKPHVRKWNQEGSYDMVEITIPPKQVKNYTDSRTQGQVQSQLGQLSQVMDSRGWSSRNTTAQQNQTDRLVPMQKQGYSNVINPEDANVPRDPLSPTNPVARDITQAMQAEPSVQDRAAVIIKQARTQNQINRPPRVGRTANLSKGAKQQPYLGHGKVINPTRPTNKATQINRPPTVSNATKVAQKTPASVPAPKPVNNQSQSGIINEAQAQSVKPKGKSAGELSDGKEIDLS